MFTLIPVNHFMNISFRFFVPRSRRFFPAVLVMFAGAFLMFSCSHSSPYYAKKEFKPQPLTVDSTDFQQRFLLIGDAGGPLPGEPVLKQLTEWAAMAPQKTTVLFLGDNIYPAGLVRPDSSAYADRKRRIDAQLSVANSSGARGIFIPGNHDWDDSGPDGLNTLARQAEYVINALGDPQSFLPEPGCPGPAVLDIGQVRLIVLDSEWWLNKFEKGSGCLYPDTAAVLAALDKAIAGAGQRPVLIAAHHPIESEGPHGGFYTWTDHVFPLRILNKSLWIPIPVIGSLYPLGRTYVFRSNQDITGPRYKDMRKAFRRVFRRHKPLLYASGHDHSLQIFDGGKDIGYYLLSGAGTSSKITDAGHNGKTLFSYAHEGFMVVDFLKSGEILLRVVSPENPPVQFEHFMRH